jgi:rubredoxin
MRWDCGTCGFIYDEAAGLPNEEIPPGTRFEDIAEDWSCPDCGVGKTYFRPIQA